MTVGITLQGHTNLQSTVKDGRDEESFVPPGGLRFDQGSQGDCLMAAHRQLPSPPFLRGGKCLEEAENHPIEDLLFLHPFHQKIGIREQVALQAVGLHAVSPQDLFVMAKAKKPRPICQAL